MDLLIEKVGIRNVVISKKAMIVMTSHDGCRQLARITVQGQHYVFPTYVDVGSEQKVTVFEHLGSIHFLIENYSLSEELKLVVTHGVAKQLRDMLCLK